MMRRFSEHGITLEVFGEGPALLTTTGDTYHAHSSGILSPVGVRFIDWFEAEIADGWGVQSARYESAQDAHDDLLLCQRTLREMVVADLDGRLACANAIARLTARDLDAAQAALREVVA